jgi:hypothetical protein
MIKITWLVMKKTKWWGEVMFDENCGRGDFKK